jgi:molybdopterin-containing oxidoreductase family iron-sulfur binding subunit
MNRMYVVETMPTVTGFKAEHRLALKPSEIATFATALANGSAPQGASGDTQKFFAALLRD